MSYFHLFNQNLKGARSMIRKCLGKFEFFDTVRGMDVKELIGMVGRVQIYLNEINNTSNIDDSYIIRLKE